MMMKHTFDPLRVHLNDLINDLYWLPSLLLRHPDLLRIPALAVYEAQYVQCHGSNCSVHCTHPKYV